MAATRDLQPGHQLGPYLAVDYLPGGSPAERLESSDARRRDDAIGALADVASGLDALRGEGIVHRDVKPANVLDDASEEAAV